MAMELDPSQEAKDLEEVDRFDSTTWLVGLMKSRIFQNFDQVTRLFCVLVQGVYVTRTKMSQIVPI